MYPLALLISFVDVLDYMFCFELPPRPLQQYNCRVCSQERRKARARRPTGFGLPHRGCSALP